MTNETEVVLTIALAVSAHLSGAVFLLVALIYGKDARRLARRYRRAQPFTAGSLVALTHICWASVVCLLLLAGAYTARILILKPRIVPYPAWALLLDLTVYVGLTVLLMIPAILMLAARKKLKEQERYDDAT